MNEVSKRRIYNIAKKHFYGLQERGDLKAHMNDNEETSSTLQFGA